MRHMDAEGDDDEQTFDDTHAPTRSGWFNIPDTTVYNKSPIYL